VLRGEPFAEGGRRAGAVLDSSFTPLPRFGIEPVSWDGHAEPEGRIAQLVEQLTLNQRVPGSSPGAPTNIINDLLVNRMSSAEGFM
jgi:hypothetical protein